MSASPSIAVMLAGKKGAASEEDDAPESEDSESGAKAGAQALREALKSGDDDAIVRAFRSLSTLCDDSDEPAAADDENADTE